MSVLASKARSRQAPGFRPAGSRPALVAPPVPTLEDAVLAASDRLARGWGAACLVCDGQLDSAGRCGSCGTELIP